MLIFSNYFLKKTFGTARGFGTGKSIGPRYATPTILIFLAQNWRILGFSLFFFSLKWMEMIGFISNVCICVTLMFQFDQLRLLQRYFCNDLDHEKINKGTSIFGTLDYLLVHWLTSKKKRKKKKNRPPCCGWPIDFRGPFVTKKNEKNIGFILYFFSSLSSGNV